MPCRITVTACQCRATTATDKAHCRQAEETDLPLSGCSHHLSRYDARRPIQNGAILWQIQTILTRNDSNRRWKENQSPRRKKKLSLLIENNNLPPKQPPAAAAVTKSKRKSAKPQWSYEGTHLDKSRKNNEGDDNFSKDIVSSSDDVEETVQGDSNVELSPGEADIKSKNIKTGGHTRSPITTTTSISDENENVTMETDDSQQQDVTDDGSEIHAAASETKKHLNCAIEKLQQAVNSKEVDWDDPISSPSS